MMMQPVANMLKKRMTFGSFTARRARGHSFILMYHRILPAEECAKAQANHALNVSTEHFDSHLAFLKKWFDITPLKELVQTYNTPKAKRAKPKLAITFDDGWHDNYQYAWPILKKHNVPATIFLVSDYIGSQKKLWWSAFEEHYRSLENPTAGAWLRTLKEIADRTSPEITKALDNLYASSSLTPENVIQHVKSVDYTALETFAHSLEPSTENGPFPEMLKWNQVKEMQHSSIEFGAHTQRHELLSLLDKSSVIETVSQSVKSLESNGVHVAEIFSYPNGNNNARVQRAVAEAGFKFAVGTNRGTLHGSNINPMELPRINIGGGNNADVTLLRQRLARAFWLQR